MTSEISRNEVRSAIEDKLCAHFGITNAVNQICCKLINCDLLTSCSIYLH